MSIGKKRFWIILRVSPQGIPCTTAVRDPKDARRSLRFGSYEAADAWAQKMPPSPLGMCFPVQIAG